jgi:hypothetical protein
MEILRRQDYIDLIFMYRRRSGVMEYTAKATMIDETIQAAVFIGFSF